MPDVFSSLPHPYFLPILSVLVIIFTFHPAVIEPFVKKRAENLKKALEKEQKEQEENEALIPLIDEILRQFDICDPYALSSNERVVQAVGGTVYEGKEHYDYLKRIIVAVYAKVKKYDPPELTSDAGSVIDYQIDFKAYIKLKKFFFGLRSRL